MSALIETAELVQVEPAVFASSGAAGAELLDAVTLYEPCRTSVEARLHNPYDFENS
jgi:hypothetical protein